jgi:putative methyltransferase (TIGR04325 family)
MVTPPAVLQIAKELRGRALGHARPWEYVAQEWREDAVAQSPRGWDVASIPRLHARQWQAFSNAVNSAHPLCVAPEHGVHAGVTSEPYNDVDVYMHHAIMTASYALAQAVWNKQSLSVLDWGGGVGHYSVIFRALYPQVTFDYNVKDLPAMVREGRQLLPDVTFFDDDAQSLARTYDFVLSSSSLQYSRDWRAGLTALANAAQGFLLVNQIPVVHDTSSFVMIQRPYGHGYDTEYLGWCFQRAELLNAAGAASLSLVREFLHGFKPDVHGAPEPPEYRGFLFRRVPSGD